MERHTKIYKIAAIGVFAALTFAGNKMYVPIPVAIGDVSRIHFGNIFCLLSGFVLGPVGGGLAAGIGGALFDLTDPAFIASSPFTFVFKFVLAAVCGWAANLHGAKAENHAQNILASAAGSLTYMILYLGKAFAQGILLGSEMGAVLTALATKAVTSGINAVIAVVVSVPLCAVVRTALKKSRLLEKMG